MIELFLPNHVYFCSRGDALVFLDAKKDSYILVEGESAAALRALTEKEADKAGLASALKEFFEKGLLTTDGRNGKTIAPTVQELATDLLIDSQTALGMKITLLHLWRFFLACLVASARLRWGELENTIKKVERRRTRLAIVGVMDIEKARALTAIFRKLRFVFPRDYLCLFDSLALIEFLALYQIFPRWVFGIRLEPWAAHCWVQEGQFIFNEGIEEAAGYTPIMVI